MIHQQVPFTQVRQMQRHFVAYRFAAKSGIQGLANGLVGGRATQFGVRPAQRRTGIEPEGIRIAAVDKPIAPLDVQIGDENADGIGHHAQKIGVALRAASCARRRCVTSVNTIIEARRAGHDPHVQPPRCQQDRAISVRAATPLAGHPRNKVSTVLATPAWGKRPI